MCRWVLVPWEFLKFNLLEAGSAQYGAHPWHWNFSQGFPTIAASLLPLGLHGLWLAHRCGLLKAPLRPCCSIWHVPCCAAQPQPPQLQCLPRQMLHIVWLVTADHLACRHAMPGLLLMWTLLTNSLPAHKEFRFLLPALQLFMPFCGLSVASLLDSMSLNTGAGNDSKLGNAQCHDELKAGISMSSPRAASTLCRLAGRHSRQQTASPLQRTWRAWAIAAALLVQAVMAAYFCLIHQR